MSNFIPTQKYIDVLALSLRPYARLLVFEGTIRSSKTESAKPIFMYNVFDSPEELHLIAANDFDAIRDNILDGETGLLAMFPNLLELRKDKIGGYYVHVKGQVPMKYPKEKKILLAGYAKANHWKKILGKTIGVILVDEANTANKQFIDEAFARQVSCDRPLQIWTLNGDVPQHWIYQEYINRANIFSKYKHQVPASIRADMDKAEKQKGWFYIHWNMNDNPTMSTEKIKAAKSIYPVGSYYYVIKILGERGAPGRLIYIDYMSKKLIKKIDLRDYPRFGIGVDIGANRAKNAFTLTGFSHGFEKVGFVDHVAFDNVGYREKTEKLKAFVKLWLQRGLNIEYIAVDSAETNYIRDLKAEFKAEGLPEVIASYKATIKERIDLNIILFSALRVEFNDTPECRALYDAFSIAKWTESKEGIEREDLNEEHIDRIDSAEYSQTRHMKKLLFAAKSYDKKEAA